MSYLDLPRLYFGGTFFSNPSTINNDPNNYNPKIQLQDTDSSAPGFVYWNPKGLAFFRIQSGKVGGYCGPNGQLLTSGSDPIFSASVVTPNQSSGAMSAGKIVDLDPDQQSISRLFGIHVAVRLADGSVVVEGDIGTIELNDLWLSRVQSSGGDPSYSGTFVGRLGNLKWGPGLSKSAFAQQLNAASPTVLAIKFNTDLFQADSTRANFCVGRIAGTIGPATLAEPEEFVAGRRLVADPLSATLPMFYPLYAKVLATGGGMLAIDVGNSIQLASGGGDFVTKRLYIGVMSASGTATPLANQPINLADVPYSVTAGVFNAPLSGAEMAAIASSPIGLYLDPACASKPVLAEPADGVWANAEPAGFRLNAGETATGTIRAYKFGQPLAGFEAPLGLVACTAHPNEPTSGMPAPTPAPPVTGNDGTVVVTFQAGSVSPSMLPRRRAPMGSQVYFWSGEWANRGNVVGNQPASSGQAAKQALFSVLVFQDQGVPPTNPTWSQVQPVLAAYARLYPGMTEIFDLSDPNMVAQYAGQIAGAIQAPLQSPYAMPVTRDMSAYNRQMIINYVSTISPSATPGSSPGNGEPSRNA